VSKTLTLTDATSKHHTRLLPNLWPSGRQKSVFCKHEFDCPSVLLQLQETLIEDRRVEITADLSGPVTQIHH
jgi:hypothetical protein